MNSTLSRVRYNKSQRIAVSILIASLLLIEIGIWKFDKNQEPSQNLSIPVEIATLQNQIDDSNQTSSTHHPSSSQIQKFNPNELDKSGWMNLGFSPKQAAVILKYKNSLGGNFSSKEEIGRCFVISEEKFEELTPYILLPEFSSGNSNSNRYQYQSGNYSNQKKINYRKFNPNEYTQNDWMAIGFSEKQALTILKYKRSLGGNFTSLEQIERCFVISEEKFQEMKPYIILSVKENVPSEIKEKTSSIQHPAPIKMEKFNPNEYTKEQWMELGFTEKQVNTIMNYKRSLGGKFKDAATLKKCYSISEEKFDELEPFLIFE